MTIKNRKLNRKKVIGLLAIILVILFIIMICYLISKKNNKYKDLSILLNNEFIKTINKVVIDENDNIYFSKDDIQKNFDETIYYNEVEEELITTYNTHVALLKLDEKYASINDETIELKGTLKQIDGKIYMPLTDLQVVYDLEIRYSKKSNRIIIDDTNSKKIEAKILKITNVKNKKGLFSSTLEKLIIGDKVVVIDNSGRYKKVRTPLGNIGYVKSKILSEEKIIREDIKNEKQELNVYKNYSNISGIYDNIQVDTSKLNVVIPTFFYIDKNSKVLDRTMNTTATYSVYKTWTDNNNLQILPSLENNSTVSTNLLSYSQRTGVINSLKDLLLKNNYIGINIKFNSIDDINSFNRFILELVPRFKTAGLKVAVTLPNNVDKSKIENIVDYIVEE